MHETVASVRAKMEKALEEQYSDDLPNRIKRGRPSYYGGEKGEQHTLYLLPQVWEWLKGEAARRNNGWSPSRLINEQVLEQITRKGE